MKTYKQNINKTNINKTTIKTRTLNIEEEWSTHQLNKRHDGKYDKAWYKFGIKNFSQGDLLRSIRR